MKIANKITYQVPSFFLSSLINADYTGLTDTEITYIKKFESNVLQFVFTEYPDAVSYHWSYDDDTTSFFTSYHDMDSDIGASDCSEIELVILEDKQAVKEAMTAVWGNELGLLGE